LTPAGPGRASAAGETLTVLVVSDDERVRSELRYGFPIDADVEMASDARDAWSKMTDRIPDVVVADLQTGSAGGYGLTRDMSQNERLAGVPVLILIDRDQDGWLARQAGARATRRKPLETAALVAAALELVERSN